ncbi:MAG: hypothetical protein M0R17_04840 [Candidatus Omnitrophica bacterium]|jgi:hypothetical protein|nr:hypothetical protein [Candidatus Omnitrophota bacterium]
MKKNIDILKEVEPELKRFTKIFKTALAQTEGVLEYGSPKYFAAVKRAALDLKQELTKITQSSKYKYDGKY